MEITALRNVPKQGVRNAAVALLVLGSAVIAGCGSSASTSGAPAKGSSVKVVHARSFCIANPSSAEMTFFVTIRNSGASSATTSVQPWRRYNDASVNDGISDTTVDFKVAAHSTKTINTTVPYDPTRHTPLACRVYLKDASNYSSIEVQ